jgi:hypothetical protein
LSKFEDNIEPSQERILCFAREAGGAEALAPVIKRLSHWYNVLLLAKDYALPIFQRHNLEHKIYHTHSKEALATLIRDYWHGLMPDVVLTSATSLPWSDMTERLLWRWAGEHSVPSIAIVDQWQNYGVRFSGCQADEHIAYLPTRITTLDDRAKQEMIKEGIPEELIVVTGQPAFDALFDEKKAFTPSDRQTVREKVGAETGSFLVVFVSEAFQRDFSDSLGYTEASTLEFLIRTLSAIVEETGIKLHLVVKFHPQNIPSDFTGLDFSQSSLKFPINIIRQEIRPRPLVLASDLVVGMTSVLLVESILLGLPTISVTLNSKKMDIGLVAISVGALPWLRLEDKAAESIGELIKDPDFRKRWLEQQKALNVLPDATGRVVREVEKLLRVNDDLNKEQS